MSEADVLLSTPVSPLHLRLAATICVLLSIVLAACCLARVDIYAVAQARILAPNRTTVIQSSEAGRVRVIHAANGSRVHAGDLLIELDSTITSAERAMYAQQLANLDADVARRMAEISIARSQSLNQVDTMQFDAGVDGTTQALERAVLAANLARLRANLRLLDAKARETKVLKRWVGVTLGQQAGLANVLQDQLELRPAALGDVNEAKLPALETESNLSNILITMPKLQEELSRENTAIDSIRSQKEDTIERFIADDVEAALAAQVKRGEIVQNLVRATARDGNMRLTAPVAGTVVELTATKVGQVVVAGQLLAKIVPDGAPTEAEAWLANRDIAFVQQGQKVLLKIDAFPFARYGTLTGRVSFVARDAVSAQEALVQTGVSATLASHGLSAPIASQIQDTVYSITIALDKSAVAVDGSLVPLIPGMSAVIEIKTGQRRVIDYLLSPIAGLFSDAAHER